MLTAGAFLGPYEILAPLGVGGMGEVYRARDVRLKREVAVKVLPTTFATDPERLRRFEQEAEAAGALNHPNVLAVYDVGTHDSAPYIVSELLEGETLRDRLASGAFTPRRAIGHALQIVQGLAAAHEKGIAHRDLKPENVFVTSDGRVKILDFGLAKLTQLEAPLPGQTNLPTAAAGTEPGVVLGTLGYMSPEQVRGRPSDARSDIFAFGAILYEMLSGRRAFHGDTAADTISAILTRDPPDLTETNHRIPEALDRIVNRCLEKAPEARFHSASDLAFDLEAISGTSLVAKAPAARVPWRARAMRLLPWVALPLAAAVFWAGRRSAGSKAAATGAGRPVEFRQLTYQPGAEYYPSFSPDGATFVYVSAAAGRPDIYLLRAGGQNALNLTKDFPAGSSEPAFSPSGDAIAFRSERDGGGIFLMGATGENVRRLTDFGFNPTWSPDHKRLAVSSDGILNHPFGRTGYGDLWTVDIATGQKKRILDGRERATKGRGDGVQPAWSPHGDRIAYWGLRGETGRRDIWTIPAEGGEAVDVTNDVATDWNPVWSPDGRFLYFGSDRSGSLNLWRVSIDEKTGRTLSEPEPATLPAEWAGHFSFSLDGKHLIYVSRAARGIVLKASFDATGETITATRAAVLETSTTLINLDVSPGGDWLAFRPSEGSRDSILLSRSDGTGLRRLTDDPFRNRGPKFAPDGKRLAFYSNRGGRYDTWTINLDGSGLTQVTKNVGKGPWYPNWSPDGTRFAFPDGNTSYIYSIGRTPGEGRVETLALLPEGGWFQVWGWSSDARLLAGFRVEGGRPGNGIYTYSVETKAFARLSDTGTNPVFLPDCRRVLYLENGVLKIVDLAGKRVRPVGGAAALGFVDDFALSKDGRTVYAIENKIEADVWEATLK